MTKVLQLIHSDENGGVEMLARLIGGDLQSAGADVETLFLYPSFKAGRLAKLRGVAWGAWQVVRRKPDVLVTYQPTASVIAGMFGRIAGTPIRIVHQVSVPGAIHPLPRFIDRIIGGRGFYTVNIANSHATMAAFASYPDAYRRNLRLVEHGVSAPEPRASRADVLASFKVPDDGPILLNSGRLIDQKAQQHIIRALPLLPKARLLLAGGGPLEAVYRELAGSLGVAGRVHFLGYLPRESIGDLLGAADVFVFPSVWETFGFALVEAGMNGLPAVCSDISVFREVMSVKGETIARFVKPEDTPNLAGAITAALGPGEAAKARSFASGLKVKYSQDAMLATYRDLVWPRQGAGSTARADIVQQHGAWR